MDGYEAMGFDVTQLTQDMEQSSVHLNDLKAVGVVGVVGAVVGIVVVGVIVVYHKYSRID